MGRITLIRHGQASLMADDYDALSDLGIEQSRRVGAWLAQRGERYDHVVMGSLRRHAQTAQACLAELGGRAAEARIDADLNEYEADGMIARLRPEFADKAAMKAWLAHSDNPRKAFQSVFADAFARWTAAAHPEDYAISWADFRARALGAVQRVAEACGSGQNALVFTSGGPITGIIQHLLGIPDERAGDAHFVLFNGGMTQLLCRPGSLALSYFNAVGPLEQAGPGFLTYR